MNQLRHSRPVHHRVESLFTIAGIRNENARLKRVVADLTLDRHILQEVVKKKI
ncbi:MAG: hypothetical protein NDI84_14690 [Steroidobacteraceae bacterium]|nr:hypothetical protein [Steroidobacteraceae bacterium]